MKNLPLYFAAFMFLAAPALAETLTARVDGMVCAFCAKGIEDKFMEDPAVQKVDVSLDESSVSVTTKQGKTLTDEAFKKAIVYMGYTPGPITRKP